MILVSINRVGDVGSLTASLKEASAQRHRSLPGRAAQESTFKLEPQPQQRSVEAHVAG
jgi:hypothetical protein